MALPVWDQKNEVIQSDSRPDCDSAIGTRAHSELTSPLVPRRTSFRRRQNLKFPTDGGLTDRRHIVPCPAKVGIVTPHAVHDDSQPA